MKTFYENTELVLLFIAFLLAGCAHSFPYQPYIEQNKLTAFVIYRENDLVMIRSCEENSENMLTIYNIDKCEGNSRRMSAGLFKKYMLASLPLDSLWGANKTSANQLLESSFFEIHEFISLYSPQKKTLRLSEVEGEIGRLQDKITREAEIKKIEKSVILAISSMLSGFSVITHKNLYKHKYLAKVMVELLDFKDACGLTGTVEERMLDCSPEDFVSPIHEVSFLTVTREDDLSEIFFDRLQNNYWGRLSYERVTFDEARRSCSEYSSSFNWRMPAKDKIDELEPAARTSALPYFEVEKIWTSDDKLAKRSEKSTFLLCAK